MARKQIAISIDKEGNVSFTINGVKGEACLKETEFLEAALGGKVTDREKTPDYYNKDTVGVGVGVKR